MNKDLFIGIDTSNYTTSLSLVSEKGIVANVRRLLPVEKGKAGLRQSDAVFFHTKALAELSRELFETSEYSACNVRAVGVSDKPRDAQGSYMPCFLAGVSFASAVSGALEVPMYTFSHQAGHISAAVATSGKTQDFKEKEFFSFHVSGGTTEALLCKYDGFTYKCTKVGGTTDASAGQIIDRAGVFCSLSFPCGKELDKIACDCQKKFLAKASMDGAFFSMSGLQNKFEKYITDGEQLCDAAMFLFDSVALSLKKSLSCLRAQYGDLDCLFAGGVMCNSHIRNVLKKEQNAYFADSILSSDNAVGTALLCKDAFYTNSNGENKWTVV